MYNRGGVQGDRGEGPALAFSPVALSSPSDTLLLPCSSFMETPSAQGAELLVASFRALEAAQLRQLDQRSNTFLVALSFLLLSQ